MKTHAQTTFSALEASADLALNAFRSAPQQETCQLIPMILSSVTILSSFLWLVFSTCACRWWSTNSLKTQEIHPHFHPRSIATVYVDWITSFTGKNQELFAFTFHDLVTLLECDKTNNLLFKHLLNGSATHCTKCLTCSRDQFSVPIYMIFTM